MAIGDYVLQQGASIPSGISLNGLGAGAGQQGDKLDLGADRAAAHAVVLKVPFASAPAAADPVEVYWANSPSAVAGTDNDGQTTGVDGAYVHADRKLQLQPLGKMHASPDGNTVTQQKTFILGSRTRYGQLVVLNGTGVAFNATGCSVEVHPIQGHTAQA